MMNIGILASINLLIYFAIIAFIIWFAVTLINTLKERNQILKDISKGINNINNRDL